MPDISIGQSARSVKLPLTRVKPLCGNTGVSGSHIPDVVMSVDWFSITIHLAVQNVLPLLRDTLNLHDWVDRGFGSNGYRQSLTAGPGIVLMFDHPGEKQDGKRWCTLALSGEGCGRVGVARLVQLTSELWLSDIRYNVTRVDFAHDTTLVDTQDVYQAWLDGDASGKFRVAPKVTGRIDRDGNGGHTVYFGSETSDVQLRVYRKAVPEHPVFANETFARFELQVRGERALHYWLYITQVTSPAQMMELSLGLLTGFVHFATEWWSRMTENIKSWWMKTHDQKPLVETTRKWLYKQVASALAMYVDAMTAAGGTETWAVVKDLLDFGRGRMSPYQQMLVEQNRGETAAFFIPQLNREERHYWPA